MRVAIRAEMEVSGLRILLDKHSVFDHASLRRYIEKYYSDAQLDESELAEHFLKEDVVMNLNGPRRIFDAILANTDGRAADFLSSTLKKLLLVPPEPEMRVRYFQLIDKIVSSIVTDRQGLDGDFSSLLGSSVASIVAKFSEQDRLEETLEDLSHAKLTIARLRRERQELTDEIALKQDGLVGTLKARVEELEKALETSRGATEAVKLELSNRDVVHAQKITELELQAREMYLMLQDANLLDSFRDDEGFVDRREVLALIKKKMDRTKTIQKLEGSPHLRTQDVDPFDGTQPGSQVTHRHPTEGEPVSRFVVPTPQLCAINPRI